MVISRETNVCAKLLARSAARYGGEEFVMLLPNTTEEGALEVARHACEAIRALHLPHTGSSHGVVTISAGAAVLPVTNGASDAELATDLLQTADFALYAAKESGRNRVVGAGSLVSLPGDAAS
jgi:diguanylate cyclase (GGDEF)-like protein